MMLLLAAPIHKMQEYSRMWTCALLHVALRGTCTRMGAVEQQLLL
jgi:hypothetical protein